MQAWETFVQHQCEEMGPEAVNKWLRPLQVVRYDACNLYLEAKDAFQVMWFEEHIRKKAELALRNNNNRTIRIHLSADGQLPKKSNKQQQKLPDFQIKFEELNPQSTFKNFLRHEGNLLAHKLLCKVVGYENDETELASFNPIYLFGPSGSGKTHLLMAAAWALQERSLNVKYARSETFTEHVVSAIRGGEMIAFRKAYRNIDVLILDDVHVFSRKRATQEELFHSFNALHMSGKQIILSSHCSPQELEHIEPRLVSRFEWGIVLSTEKPSQEDSKAIIEKKAALMNFPLSSKMIDYLVTTFKSSTKGLTRALEALVLRNHLKSNQKHYPNQVTIPLIKHLLGDLIQEEERHLLTPDKIILHTGKHFDIETEDIIGKGRSRDLALPRQIAMYLCRKQLKLSYTKIGDIFNRDHTTVMASVKAIEKGLAADNAEMNHPIVNIKKSMYSND